MKKLKLMLTGALLSVSIGVCADEITQGGTTYTANDNSPLAELCLAALESREAMERKARELNIKRRALDKIACNDMSLIEFARLHQQDPRERAIATVQ